MRPLRFAPWLEDGLGHHTLDFVAQRTGGDLLGPGLAARGLDPLPSACAGRWESGGSFLGDDLASRGSPTPWPPTCARWREGGGGGEATLKGLAVEAA